MRRHLFIVVSAVVVVLGVFFAADCGETGGTGGTGGSGGTGGPGGAGGVGGTGGIAGTGGSGGGGTGGTPKCESAEDCDDQNECTDDACDPSSSSCEHAPVPDGRRCGGENYWGDPNGGCYAGLCNFVPVSVAIGEKEVVFDWSAEHCEDLDVPDGPAKVVRAEDGELVLFDSNAPTYYVSRGADFDAFERGCDPPALVSADMRAPESYENWEWLWTFYRQGTSWHALIHNEFHDAVALTCKPGDPSPANPCWYNSITYAVSTDGARTFAKPSPPPHVVAPAPRVWTPPDAPVQSDYVDGYFEPTNIVLGPDDYYYALMKKMRIDPTKGIDERGVCAMRTKTLDNPASWRAWDGSGFNLPLTSPYVAGGDVPECESVETASGGARGLTYNTYLERYMLVDEHVSWETGEEVCGFTFSTSLDLIHWSEHQLITPARIGCDTDDTTPGQLEKVRTYYPSIIDHEDSTINFERPGRTPYLYYTRNNEGFWLDRDLVRVPLTFTLEE